MQNNDFILTVIIPTRNRADTLKHAIKTIIAQPQKNIEILVSDNFSGPEVKQVFDSFEDERLRYIRTDKILGMGDHWDFAIANARGKWVSIIGDDDGMIPDAVSRFLSLAQKHPDIKAITCANSWYRWPKDGVQGKLVKISGKGYEVRSCRDYMKKALQGKPVSQPTVYTGGFVHSDLIKKIRSKTPDGRFINSITPDYYSGMAICSIAEEYIYVWESWCVAGTSKHSTGMEHKHKTVAERQKMNFHKDNSIKFNSKLGDAAEASMGSMNIYLYEAFLQSEHLRDYDLGITMQQQIEVSVMCAGKRIRNELIEYWYKIAEQNGFDAKPYIRKGLAKRTLFKVGKLIRKFQRSLGFGKLPQQHIKINEINNIYDAAIELGKRV